MSLSVAYNREPLFFHVSSKTIPTPLYRRWDGARNDEKIAICGPSQGADDHYQRGAKNLQQK